MTFQTSTERRLWTTAAVLQTAIYLSLSLGDNVVRFLRDNGLLQPVVVIVLLACALAAGRLIQSANMGRRAWIVAGLMVGVYALVLANVHRPEEKLHIVEYGAITGLIFEALRHRNLPGGRLWVPFVVAALAGSVLGLLDEGIQFLLPDRVGEFSDAVLNFGAAVLAATSLLLLHWTSELSQESRSKNSPQ